MKRESQLASECSSRTGRKELFARMRNFDSGTSIRGMWTLKEMKSRHASSVIDAQFVKSISTKEEHLWWKKKKMRATFVQDEKCLLPKSSLKRLQVKLTSTDASKPDQWSWGDQPKEFVATSRETPNLRRIWKGYKCIYLFHFLISVGKRAFV